jgi:PIN domain nuclease of toxin-antitoxin system
MASVVYLDTHVLAWLYAGRVDLLSEEAGSAIDRSSLLISPMAQLELQYLYEIGRVKESSEEVCEDLRVRLDLKICPHPFSDIAQRALGQDWTRDPFDRLITAHASLRSAPLITKDSTIRQNYGMAIW